MDGCYSEGNVTATGLFSNRNPNDHRFPAHTITTNSTGMLPTVSIDRAATNNPREFGRSPYSQPTFPVPNDATRPHICLLELMLCFASAAASSVPPLSSVRPSRVDTMLLIGAVFGQLRPSPTSPDAYLQEKKQKRRQQYVQTPTHARICN